MMITPLTTWFLARGHHSWMIEDLDEEGKRESHENGIRSLDWGWWDARKRRGPLVSMS